MQVEKNLIIMQSLHHHEDASLALWALLCSVLTTFFLAAFIDGWWFNLSVASFFLAGTRLNYLFNLLIHDILFSTQPHVRIGCSICLFRRHSWLWSRSSSLMGRFGFIVFYQLWDVSSSSLHYQVCFGLFFFRLPVSQLYYLFGCVLASL